MVTIAENTLSTAITGNSTVDLNWFREAGSPVVDWLKKPVASATNLLDKIAKGGKELLKSITNGTFGKIFNQWAKDDPLAAAAGTVAAGLAGASLLIVGGNVVGWVVGGVSNALSGIGSIAGGMIGNALGDLASGILSGAETIYDFNLQISDDEILADIKESVNDLYEPAGEFMGRQIASIATGGLNAAPQVEIDIEMLSLLWESIPDIRQNLLETVSNFANLALETGVQLAIKYAFMQGRAGIKSLWEKSPQTVKKLLPGLDKAISTWGDKDQKPWSLSSGIKKIVKSITNEQIKSVAGGVISQLWPGFNENIKFIGA